ncbi:hypothetical protein MTO96_002137 [Rhipicephalus appendiculatus]
MELREKRGGSLSLVSYPPFEADMIPLPGEHADRASAFLRWLLRTHVCITGLELEYELLKIHCQLFLEEVPENSRLKKLKVHFPLERAVQTHFATLLPRLRHLEELDCYMSPSADALVAAVSALLGTTTCLSSLVFQACFNHGQPPRTFVDALAANSTLKTLDLWANWSTTEPPGTLGEYVRSNRLITTLHLFGEESDREELSLEEVLVRNSTLTTLNIGRLCGGERTARFLTRVLAECASIKKLTLGGLRDEYVNISEATMTRCGQALAQNETLKELDLSYSLWHPNNWIAFFAFLPKNKHLKKLEVSNHRPADYGTFPSVLEALTETGSSERVSFGRYTYQSEVPNLMHIAAFSGIDLYGVASLRVSALQRLPSLHHFTSVSLDLHDSDETLFSSFAEYIRATTALRELRLIGPNAANAAPSSWWTLFFESLSVNTSIAYLTISASENPTYIGRLARTIGLSRHISRVTYVQCRCEWDPTDFVLPLSEVVGDNYGLLEVQLKGAKLGADAARTFFTIWDATRRNCGLLERASAFNQNTPLDWYTANALEKVSRNPALVRELAEKEGIAACQVARTVRSRLSSVGGLHEFMRLTGVVQQRVTCAPPVDDCGTQLEDLGNDCWRLLRRYLSFGDVKRFPVGKPDNSTFS